jgi:hypothetical protein
MSLRKQRIVDEAEEMIESISLLIYTFQLVPVIKSVTTRATKVHIAILKIFPF